MEEDMRKIAACLFMGSLVVARPAVAHDTTTPFASRGACESASADESEFDRSWLLDAFPDIFASNGEVSSFLTKAWTCGLNASDGQYYITDHRLEVLNSDWFNHRKK
jgi:hypothetical protein